MPERPRLGLRARLFLVSMALLVAGLLVGALWVRAAVRAGPDAATAWRLVGAGAVLGMLVAAGMSSLAVALASQPIRELTETARAMVQDFNVRARLRRDDEVGALGGALDALADHLTRSLAHLERERDRLGAILEGMVEGVLVTDSAGHVALANRAVREMFGVTRDVIGLTPIEALRSAELHEAFEAARRERATVARELTVMGDRPRQVTVRVAPVDSPAAGAVAVVSDVTELRRLETVRRDFVANVSHELRTPVAAIRASVETLLLGAVDDPAPAREFVAIIDRHGERLHRLVEDLLQLSKLESRDHSLSLASVDVAAAIDHAIELLAVAAQARRATITADVAPEVVAARADRPSLEHVLTNLIENAIKYSPEGSAVTVRARRQGERVRVTVEDNGPGIEPRHLGRIFERFYRVDTGRSRALGGTGLGLAIVKHLGEAMRAPVTVESAVGRGTSFHVDLLAPDFDEPSRGA
jgi:two-component system phosphate regulon sensor histidine kinase PhoR